MVLTKDFPNKVLFQEYFVATGGEDMCHAACNRRLASGSDQKGFLTFIFGGIFRCSLVLCALRRGANRDFHPIQPIHLFKPVSTEAFKPVSGSMWQSVVM